MFKVFSHIGDLMDEVKHDKSLEGCQSFAANRYPVRFVLFDNFRDSFEFVEAMQSEYGCIVESVENWFEEPYLDVLFTHSKVADRFTEFVRNHQNKDYVISPFSELIRFYDNSNRQEFYSVISTIKGTENGDDKTRRVYIPIVGLEGKFSQFENDSQIQVWHFRNSDQQLDYRLIVTDGTIYGVGDLEGKYTVVKNMREWLQLWRNKNAKPQIISSSPTLFANYQFAEPDNAFTYCKCENVYRFLTDGLKLDFGTLDYKTQDDAYWSRLATEINIDSFSFEQFFNSYFHIDDLSDYRVFMDKWFGCKDEFEKWLLCNYYSYKFCEKGYICKAIKKTTSVFDYHFFASVALSIFDDENPEQDIEERLACLQAAAAHGVRLTIDAQDELKHKLVAKAKSEGYHVAVRYFSPLTEVEKCLMVEWVGKEYIQREEVKNIFPELYHYLGNDCGIVDTSEQWVLEYFEKYHMAKLANTYSDNIKAIIETKNATSITFNTWYQGFKTVKTLLNNRTDIEVYYWIDGLGVEWIPLINQLVAQKEGVYLNEAIIGRALLPTVTENNKKELHDLAGDRLAKIGDLDAHAHKMGNHYPQYVIEEIEIVEHAVEQIVSQFAGRKVAIVSDHGLTALSQCCDGLNLKGFVSDHGGRLAFSENGKPTADSNYIICDDNKTVCALRHDSLCGKIPSGQSAHGGCTPEEVLVPIIILSAQKNVSNYAVALLTKEVSAANAVVEFKIKGLTESDKPYMMYANQKYELRKNGDNFTSDKLKVAPNNNTLKLHIGTFSQEFTLVIKTGAEEEDLFDF